MKNAYWGYFLILLGVFIVVIMLLVRSVTSDNTQDNYDVKEITKAAMIDAIDYAYYREYREIKMNKEKFYESFLRRLADKIETKDNYTVKFTGVYEAPPKASVEIKTSTNTYNVSGDATNFDVVNRTDMIIEGGIVE